MDVSDVLWYMFHFFAQFAHLNYIPLCFTYFNNIDMPSTPSLKTQELIMKNIDI